MVAIFFTFVIMFFISLGWAARGLAEARKHKKCGEPKSESNELSQISATLYATANELYITGAREAKYGRAVLSKNKFSQADALIERARKMEAKEQPASLSTPAVEAPYPTEQVEYVDASDSSRGYGV